MAHIMEQSAPAWEHAGLSTLFSGPQRVVPSRCLRLQRHAELHGGLRSRAVAQRWVVDVVVKVGCFAELVKQREYIQRLPSRFRALFPQIFLLEPVAGADQGVLVMERLAGESLHHFVLNPARSLRAKQQALRTVLQQLSDLHRSPCGQALVQRDPGRWARLICARAGKASLPAAIMDRVTRSLHMLGRQTVQPQIAQCLIHGDAQAGNFIIGDTSGRTARWIDPLGGSSDGVGDYVYDLSRMYHWLDGAAQCCEWESAPRSAQRSQEQEVVQLHEVLDAALWSQLQVSADYFRDRMAHFWFYLYAAFHVSGKLSDFRSPASQRLLSGRLLGYLERAVMYWAGEQHPTDSSAGGPQGIDAVVRGKEGLSLAKVEKVAR
jgi:hypothetical protein